MKPFDASGAFQSDVSDHGIKRMARFSSARCSTEKLVATIERATPMVTLRTSGVP